MTERVKKLDYEFDWIYSYYQECTRVNPIALKYDEELKNIKEQQFELIKHFFYYLYVKNDLDKCKNSVDNFMAYFENIQDRLSEIYKDLVMLFSY